MTALINSIQALLIALWAAIKTAFEWLPTAFSQVIGSFLRFPAWVWAIWSYVGASIITVVIITTDCVKMIVDAFVLIGSTIANLPQFQGSAAVGSAMPVLQGINTFIPLEEAFAFLTTFMFVFVTCYTIRAIKGFIPGEN